MNNKKTHLKFGYIRKWILPKKQETTTSEAYNSHDFLFLFFYICLLQFSQVLYTYEGFKDIQLGYQGWGLLEAK